MATKKKRPIKAAPVTGPTRTFSKPSSASRVPDAISSMSADLAELQENQSGVEAELQEDQSTVVAELQEDQTQVNAAAGVDQSPVPAPNPIYPVLPQVDQPKVKAVSRSKADQIYADVKISSLIPAYLAARKK